MNQNYEDLYETELKNVNGSKSLIYTINLDKEIVGNLNLSSKENFGIGEPGQFTFTPEIDIGSMIRSILYASKEVNEIIAGGRDEIYKEFHPNVRIPIIKCSYLLGKDTVSVIYDVLMYNGGKTDQNTFEFDYYFSGPGQNVDVMEFEIRYPSMINWMSGSVTGTNLNTNNDSEIPKQFPQYNAENNTHPDITRTEIYGKLKDPKPINALSGDPAFTSVVNSVEGTGHAKYQAHAVPAARLAFETISLLSGAINPQLNFTIRGYYQILERVVMYPEIHDSTASNSIGLDNGAWTKVNIFNADGSPFFYTGFYRILSVENIFSGGKFTQNLTVMMMDRE